MSINALAGTRSGISVVAGRVENVQADRGEAQNTKNEDIKDEIKDAKFDGDFEGESCDGGVAVKDEDDVKEEDDVGL